MLHADPPFPPFRPDRVVAVPPRPAYRGRFAPSPTGPLHFGSLLAAFGSWLAARRAGGEWRVRIEDLDPPREMPGAAEAQLRTLHGFGLVPDGEVWRQSTRGDAYRAALETLLASGDAFACHCSRADLAAHHGIHRACVARGPRPDPAIRLRVPDGTRIGFADAFRGPVRQALDGEVGDFVLRRADGLWAYQLAVVVDDAAQGITEVVRGADLLDSTARQIFLRQRLGLPVPGHAHLPLAVDAAGGKLSKSSAALPVDPADPLPALRAAWAALGQAPGALDAHSLDAVLASAVREFDRARVPRAPHRFAAAHNVDVTARA